MRRRVLTTAVLCGVVISAAWVWAERRPKAGPVEKTQRRQVMLDAMKKTGIDSPPKDALLLRILIQARNAQRGVEVGTAVGFGAINMGMGFERTGGHLDTIDISAKMVKAARENIKKAGLEKTVTVIQGDALKVLPTLTGEYDFVFLDAVKKDYIKYLQALEPRLKVGAVVVGHNAIRAARSMKEFLDYVRNSPDWEMVIVQTTPERKDGMAVCYKIR